jgi:formamidopyrimidine-DNA glycosylase
MPELPDIVVYMEALEQRVMGHVLERSDVRGPSLLRTADPPIASIHGHAVTGLRRVGKRIAFGFDNDLWLVFHLMIAGRLHWSQKRKAADGRRTLAAFDFDSGTLTLTEAGTRKRASRRHRCLCRLAGAVPRGAYVGKSHAEARTHRPAAVQRHR